MQESLFEYLSYAGFGKNSEQQTLQQVSRMSRRQLGDAVNSAIEATEYTSTRASTPFEFSASGTYSGDPEPCGSLTCRADRIRELAHFSSLYADRVVLRLPFSRISTSWDLDRLRTEFFFSVMTIHLLKPLLAHGLVQFVKEIDSNLCLSCYSELIGESAPTFKRRFARLVKTIDRRYETEVTYAAEEVSGEVTIVPRGSSDLIDEHHFGVSLAGAPPPELGALLKKHHGNRVILPGRIVRKSRIPSFYAEPVVRDLMNQNLCSTRLGTGFLTARGVDLQFVNALSPRTTRDRNYLLQNDFSHSVPVVKDLPLSALVKLRRQEGAAFEVYRAALRQAIDQAKSTDPHRIRQVFSDVVAPEIKKMENTVHSVRKALRRGIGIDAGAAIGTISIGLFSGLLPVNIGAILGALGGIHFTKELGRKFHELTLVPPTVRDNKYYFLWKVSNARSGLRLPST